MPHMTAFFQRSVRYFNVKHDMTRHMTTPVAPSKSCSCQSVRDSCAGPTTASRSSRPSSENVWHVHTMTAVANASRSSLADNVPVGAAPGLSLFRITPFLPPPTFPPGIPHRHSRGDSSSLLMVNWRDPETILHQLGASQIGQIQKRPLYEN